MIGHIACRLLPRNIFMNFISFHTRPNMTLRKLKNFCFIVYSERFGVGYIIFLTNEESWHTNQNILYDVIIASFIEPYKLSLNQVTENLYNQVLFIIFPYFRFYKLRILSYNCCKCGPGRRYAAFLNSPEHKSTMRIWVLPKANIFFVKSLILVICKI